MSVSRIHHIIIAGVILFFLIITTVYGFDDGFGQAKKIDGKYFIIYYATQLDITGLSQQLNIGLAEEILVGKSVGGGLPSDSALVDMLDTLFMQVCDILDMHLYSFQGKIKVCQDKDQLGRIYKTLFDKESKGMYSFYTYDLNTIYIYPESFIREVLGHEIAHAIISHYFVVQPPEKIQEILAGYVEYQLRKTGQK